MNLLPKSAFGDVTLETGAVCRMPDGARLVADIWRPNGNGPWPVLLMRQPYGRDIASTVVYAPPAWFARQGFMVVVQDVRGRGGSDGVFDPFRQEIADGHLTVEWASKLRGSNGRVGMYGFSYQGSTQLYAALGGHRALRALAPHMTAFDLFSGWFYRDGILQLSTTLAWANQMLREDVLRAGPPSLHARLEASWLNPGALSTRLPIASAEPLVGPGAPGYAADWLGRSSYDSYWRSLDLLPRIRDLGLPMHHVAGTYDFYSRGSFDGYSAMASAHPNQVLVAAPWVHIPWGPQSPGGFLGGNAIPDVDAQLVKWFHHWLDAETPAGPLPLPGCHAFVLNAEGGSGAWREFPSWPPPDCRPLALHLASAGKANSRFGDGRLVHAPADTPCDTFNYDPEVPVLAPGGNHGGSAGWGPFDLSSQQQGNNLLVYTSDPLPEAAVVAGNPVVVLHVSSSAPATDFVVRLSRVTPSQTAQFLALGARRIADTTQLAQSEGIEVRLDAVCAEIQAGDRIRIDVASSAHPLLIRHPNTDVDPAHIASPAEFRRATQIVHHDRTRPSRLILPLLNT
jgi:uncharacterized protein